MPPTILADRYELDRRLGRGGMAEVWRGIDLVLGRRVAVKVVDVGAVSDPTLGDRLRREAVATAALEHPDIVTVHDAGVDGDIAYIVMERLRGRDLAAVLQDGPLRVDEALRIAGRVAGALTAAHAAGIVHRDVKPANILVDGDKVTVVDFGIAAFEYQSASSLTAPGTTLGTAEYMAPEQARAESVTRSTDMYAFGCLLTTLVAGQPPFTGEVPVAILHQHAYIEAPRLKKFCPDAPDELDRLVAGLLAKDPDARPSATEVQEVLGELTERFGAGLPAAVGAMAAATAGTGAATGFVGSVTVIPDAVSGAPTAARHPVSPMTAASHALSPITAAPHAVSPMTAATAYPGLPTAGTATTDAPGSGLGPAPTAATFVLPPTATTTTAATPSILPAEEPDDPGVPAWVPPTDARRSKRRVPVVVAGLAAVAVTLVSVNAMSDHGPAERAVTSVVPKQAVTQEPAPTESSPGATPISVAPPPAPSETPAPAAPALTPAEVAPAPAAPATTPAEMDPVPTAEQPLPNDPSNRGSGASKDAPGANKEAGKSATGKGQHKTNKGPGKGGGAGPGK
ncbi:serine/threonine-protein kinase [Georgenia sp. SYP-B2076]|uniref:serine/threonine-protein kinase n=1 Tax=Georgenia sp. SYP-B2076 TaxID=2495881 RepID=UPI000F8DF7A8|nr:serine/threonine-protein kinase [Georgenia sp. SYP-B2076]